MHQAVEDGLVAPQIIKAHVYQKAVNQGLPRWSQFFRKVGVRAQASIAGKSYRS